MDRSLISVDEILFNIKRNLVVDELLRNGMKWDAFRELYKAYLPDITARGMHYGIDPYIINWPLYFTPIEADAWSTIRGLGIPIYPQFPVGNVFVDFGDPVKKIAIECDGKNWHNKEKDEARDWYLADLGWIVFRVSGRECKKPELDHEDLRIALHDEEITTDEYDRIIRDWSLNTSDGVISAIGWKFYGKSFRNSQYFDQTLSKHSNNY